MVADSEGLPEKALAVMEEGALLNASKHEGKADVGAVIGRVLAEFPELRSEATKVSAAAKAAVGRVNSMTLEQQASLLREKYSGGTAKKEKEGRSGLPPLPNAVRGKAAFRLPPEPSGFMTVGHAMAFTINYLYKEEYDGKLWLRFEDTNPRKVSPQYYDSFRRGIAWLGIKCDQEKNVSDDIETIYSYGRRLVEQGDAYACSCDEAKVKRLRFEGTACEHRDTSIESNLKVWDSLVSKKHREGDYVIRLKGDMGSVNYSLRDTNLFRVIDHPHPLVGSKYSLWPTYDLANAVEDQITGITHVLRSSEFRNEVQTLLREKLGFRKLEVIQFSRFNFRGTPVAKRLLRPLVEKGIVSGWDDPRMPTVDGLRRRGVLPQAIREFTLHVGYTKTEHEYDWSILMSINRKLLDPVSKRLFFVPDPVKLVVDGAPARRVNLQYHPEAALGMRTVDTEGTFLVAGADVKAMQPGSMFRLMDLYNVELTTGGTEPRAKYLSDEVVPGSRKFQWVSGQGVPLKVLVPDVLFLGEEELNPASLKEVHGVAESSASSLAVGEIVQFPRFGFCRVDSPGVLIYSS